MIKERYPTVQEACEYLVKMKSPEQSRVQKDSWRKSLGDDFVKRVNSEIKKRGVKNV